MASFSIISCTTGSRWLDGQDASKVCHRVSDAFSMLRKSAPGREKGSHDKLCGVRKSSRASSQYVKAARGANVKRTLKLRITPDVLALVLPASRTMCDAVRRRPASKDGACTTFAKSSSWPDFSGGFVNQDMLAVRTMSKRHPERCWRSAKFAPNLAIDTRQTLMRLVEYRRHARAKSD